MSLVNNSANNFKDFLDAIKPYLNYQFYDMSGQGVEANNFSTDEKVIGTWTDGKPLYQKVLTGNTKTEAGWKTYDTGIGSGIIDKVISMNGCIAYSNGWTTSTGSTATGSHIMFDVKPATGEWEVYVGDNGAGFNCPAILILRYTKTTDTAVASGEKIVGQWIDGKPVYEKTITSTIPMCSQQYVPESSYESIGVSVDKCIEINGFFESNGICTPISYAMAQGDTKVSCITARVLTNTASEHKNTIQLSNANTGWGGHSAIITLRYTKTT